MLAITVEFILGVLRANSADDVALTADDPVGEWPPSPARLVSALVAGAGTERFRDVPVGNVGLSLLEGATPDIYASAPHDVCRTSTVPRFVVVDERTKNTVQNYPTRAAQRISPGERLSPLSPQVVYVWPGLEPTDEQLHALRYRAARVSYVGCSDSPARVTVSRDVDDPDAQRPGNGLPRWRAAGSGHALLPVPPAGFVEALDDHFEHWSSNMPMRRSWLSTPSVWYHCDSAEGPAQPSAPQPVTLWVRFDRPVQQRRFVVVAETLRNAVLTHVSDIVGGHDAVPTVLHGHMRERGQSFQSARWIPLPTAGVPHADGKIRGACVWLPSGTDAAVVEMVREAIHRTSSLVAPKLFDVTVSLFDGTKRPWSSHPLRWTGPATRWVSVTPVVHERYGEDPSDLETVTRWCLNAGLPAPVACAASEMHLLNGSGLIPHAEQHRGGRLRGPRSFLTLDFASPISGPLTLGKGRGFGLGLMAPVLGRHDSEPRTAHRADRDGSQ